MKNFFLLSQLSRLNVSQFYVVVPSPLGLSRNSMLMFTPKTDYSVKRTFRQILQIRLVPIDNGVNILNMSSLSLEFVIIKGVIEIFQKFTIYIKIHIDWT